MFTLQANVFFFVFFLAIYSVIHFHMWSKMRHMMFFSVTSVPCISSDLYVIEVRQVSQCGGGAELLLVVGRRDH